MGFDPAFWTDWAAQDLGLTTSVTTADIVRWILGEALQTNPGTQCAYSNFGYVVAGRIIEKITGQPYEAAIRQFLAQAGVTRVQSGANRLADRAAVLHGRRASRRHGLLPALRCVSGRRP